MKTVIPQFRTVENQLIFCVPKALEEAEAVHQAKMLELLDPLPTTEVTEFLGRIVIKADVDTFTKKGVYIDRDGKQIESLLGPVNDLIPFKSAEDVGIGLSMITFSGPVIDIYPSFQTWLETGGGDINEAFTASYSTMNGIFGLKPRKSVTHHDIAIGVERTEFSVTAHEEREEAIVEKSASVFLNVPALQTLGNCACLGSNASNRRIFVNDTYADLYSLEPHNVDNLRQTLSMIAGLGRLAAAMPHVYDENALFRDIHWHEEVFPRNF